MTTEADLSSSNRSAPSPTSLIDAVPPVLTEPRGGARSQPAAVSFAGDVRQIPMPLQTDRGCRVAEPVAELHAWLTDVPDHAVLLIYRTFLDCLNPR